ncbi:MAG: hypothetical protein ACSHWZ_05815 [Sulfitobacter sp.]
MSAPENTRGGAPVGYVSELDSIEAASVIYLRLWCDGPDAQTQVWQDFSATLGEARGDTAYRTFGELCTLCTSHGRRPLMRHAVTCKCLGADESCFANFIASAADGAHEDALMLATLIVRPDVAPLITALATDFGLALKRMQLCAPRSLHGTSTPSKTLH